MLMPKKPDYAKKNAGIMGQDLFDSGVGKLYHGLFYVLVESAALILYLNLRMVLLSLQESRVHSVLVSTSENQTRVCIDTNS